jgi:hypothetical protein
MIEPISATPDPTPVFLPRKTRWVVGVDLGQSSDPTAISVLEHIVGVHDFNSAFERHCGIGRIPQTKAERVNVRHLEDCRSARATRPSSSTSEICSPGSRSPPPPNW